jgi:hypothetical protein
MFRLTQRRALLCAMRLPTAAAMCDVATAVGKLRASVAKKKSVEENVTRGIEQLTVLSSSIGAAPATSTAEAATALAGDIGPLLSLLHSCAFFVQCQKRIAEKERQAEQAVGDIGEVDVAVRLQPLTAFVAAAMTHAATLAHAGTRRPSTVDPKTWVVSLLALDTLRMLAAPGPALDAAAFVASQLSPHAADLPGPHVRALFALFARVLVFDSTSGAIRELMLALAQRVLADSAAAQLPEATTFLAAVTRLAQTTPTDADHKGIATVLNGLFNRILAAVVAYLKTPGAAAPMQAVALFLAARVGAASALATCGGTVVQDQRAVSDLDACIAASSSSLTKAESIRLLPHIHELPATLTVVTTRLVVAVDSMSAAELLRFRETARPYQDGARFKALWNVVSVALQRKISKMSLPECLAYVDGGTSTNAAIVRRLMELMRDFVAQNVDAKTGRETTADRGNALEQTAQLLRFVAAHTPFTHVRRFIAGATGDVTEHCRRDVDLLGMTQKLVAAMHTAEHPLPSVAIINAVAVAALPVAALDGVPSAAFSDAEVSPTAACSILLYENEPQALQRVLPLTLSVVLCGTRDLRATTGIYADDGNTSRWRGFLAATAAATHAIRGAKLPMAAAAGQPCVQDVYDLIMFAAAQADSDSALSDLSNSLASYAGVHRRYGADPRGTSQVEGVLRRALQVAVSSASLPSSIWEKLVFADRILAAGTDQTIDHVTRRLLPAGNTALLFRRMSLLSTLPSSTRASATAATALRRRELDDDELDAALRFAPTGGRHNVEVVLALAQEVLEHRAARSLSLVCAALEALGAIHTSQALPLTRKLTVVAVARRDALGAMDAFRCLNGARHQPNEALLHGLRPTVGALVDAEPTTEWASLVSALPPCYADDAALWDIVRRAAATAGQTEIVASVRSAFSEVGRAL